RPGEFPGVDPVRRRGPSGLRPSREGAGPGGADGDGRQTAVRTLPRPVRPGNGAADLLPPRPVGPFRRDGAADGGAAAGALRLPRPGRGAMTPGPFFDLLSRSSSGISAP